MLRERKKVFAYKRQFYINKAILPYVFWSGNFFLIREFLLTFL